MAMDLKDQTTNYQRLGGMLYKRLDVIAAFDYSLGIKRTSPRVKKATFVTALE